MPEYLATRGIFDLNGREILVGSQIRLSEEGREMFKDRLPKFYRGRPNFRCVVKEITPDGKIIAEPTESPDGGRVGNNKDLFSFFAEQIIVE